MRQSAACLNQLVNETNNRQVQAAGVYSVYIYSQYWQASYAHTQREQINKGVIVSTATLQSLSNVVKMMIMMNTQDT